MVVHNYIIAGAWPQAVSHDKLALIVDALNRVAVQLNITQARGCHIAVST